MSVSYARARSSLVVSLPFPFARASRGWGYSSLSATTLSDRARVGVSRTPFSRLALISRSTTSRVLSAFALARRRRHDRLFGVVVVGVVTTASPRAQSSRLGAHALASPSRRRARRVSLVRVHGRVAASRAPSRARARDVDGVERQLARERPARGASSSRLEET